MRNELPAVYLCDPEKNEECKKTCCQKECFYTIKASCSKDGKRYRYNGSTHKFEDMDAR